MTCFDLKSAYHHISIDKRDWKYLGFSIILEGKEMFFTFVVLPFGFYDSICVLTKVMRHVLTGWRQGNIMSFIHIDDGIIASKEEEEARKVSERVQKDLRDFGLILSPDKCIWKPTRKLTWTGIEWDTELFLCRIPEKKMLKAERKIQSILSRKQKVPVKDLASVCGLHLQNKV